MGFRTARQRRGSLAPAGYDDILVATDYSGHDASNAR